MINEAYKSLVLVPNLALHKQLIVKKLKIKKSDWPTPKFKKIWLDGNWQHNNFFGGPDELTDNL